MNCVPVRLPLTFLKNRLAINSYRRVAGFLIVYYKIMHLQVVSEKNVR